MCVLSQRTDRDEAEMFAQLQNSNRAAVKSYGLAPKKKSLFVRAQRYPHLVFPAREHD